MISDEEYEAELQARTPEQWAELRDKALADGYDIVALSHLMWRRDIKDWEHITKLLSKPDMSLEDKDYALRQVSEIAETLRNARDNPEERERRRWFNVMSCAAMVASNKKEMEVIWLKNARDSFSAHQSPNPGGDAPLLAQATYAVECLLDAMLIKSEDRAELENRMNAWFMGWCDENGIRRVSFPSTPYDEALRKQKQGNSGRHGARFNANGQGEMFGAEIIPLKPEVPA
jgi:hypothetical protein